MKYRASVDAHVYLCELEPDAHSYRITIGDRQFHVDAVQLDSAGQLSLLIDGVSHEFDLQQLDGVIQCRDEHGSLPVRVRPGWRAPAPTQAAESELLTGVTTLRAEMPGVVAELRVDPGARTEPQQTLLVLEAMKMLNTVGMDQGGTVRKIHVRAGQTVKKGDPLLDIEYDG